MQRVKNLFVKCNSQTSSCKFLWMFSLSCCEYTTMYNFVLILNVCKPPTLLSRFHCKFFQVLTKRSTSTHTHIYIYVFVACVLRKKLYKDCCTITYIFIIYEISVRKINHSLVEQVTRHSYTITCHKILSLT